MKVVFVDFDGVLNSDKYVRNCGHYGVVIDPAKMELLKMLVDETDARIVLSTSWRNHWSQIDVECDETGIVINDIFKEYKLTIYDKTPDFGYNNREAEIKSWLDTHGVTSFVVLDDAMLDSTGFLKDRFVKTSNFANGLTEEDVEKAVSILNG